MATFKKKYFEEEDIEELINKDGGLIDGDGDYADRQASSDSEVYTDTPKNSGDDTKKSVPLTTDKKRKNAHGAMTQIFNPYYSRAQQIHVAEGEKILAKERMEGLIEDLLSQKSNSSDVVSNNRVQDINRNDIPDIGDITSNNQALANAITSVVETINNQDIKGEEAGIILNFIISNIDVQDIPNDYRRIIKSKI